MSAEHFPREALIPWLVLAVCLHALAILGLRVDLSEVRAREHPVLEVSLAMRGAAGSEPASTAAPVPIDHERQAAPGPEAQKVATADSAAPVAVSEDRRRPAATEGVPSTRETQPGRPARKPAEEMPMQREPAVARAVDTADGVRAPEENPTRVNVATLERHVSDWSAEYSQRVFAEPGLPARNAYVEKVSAANRVSASAYERDWQDKVERVGNLNYPEEARRKNLNGGLMLSVGVNADGTVHAIQVRRSSGHPELDEAAQRIVELAAPYAMFPEDLKKDYDILWITRTWRFYVDNHLATTP